jgi:hypothetical protein
MPYDVPPSPDEPCQQCCRVRSRESTAQLAEQREGGNLVMSVFRSRSRSPQSLVFRATALFVVGALVAYCCAPTEPTLNPASRMSATQVDAPPRPVSERVQELLAQGGCPGWITVANDAELRGTLDRGVYDKQWRETAAHEPTPPRIQYPTPVRVAAAIPSSALGVFREPPPPSIRRPPTEGPVVQLLHLPPVDAADELIPEGEDLLLTSPEVAGATAAPSAGAPVELPPTEDPNTSNEDATTSAAPEGLNPSDNELLGRGEDSLIPPSTEAPVDTAPGDSEPPHRPLAQPPADMLNENDDLLIPPTSPPREALPTPPLAPGPSRPEWTPVTPPPTLPATRPSAPASSAASASPTAPAADAQDRCEFVAKSLYPSASECRACHEKIYDEWSMSSHAYAFVSPMFHKFEQKINDVASGTIGYFCYRCHTPAGTSLGISRAAPIWNVPLVAREGVTCVACHRVREMYGKSNGERRIEPGNIFEPVYGSMGGEGVAIAAAQKSQLKVHTSPHDKGPGIDMHASAELMPQLAHSEFCTSCHQVAVYPGIKLEVVWEQYRASPACKKGVSCQNCHMGRIPGVPSGYECGPAALINKKDVHPSRKHSNHVFYGPGYSIAHPGVFPFNPKAERWSVRDWLLFDWRAGWGTDDFEDAVDDGVIQVAFPEVWKEADDRYDARDIIDDNLKKKALKDRLRREVMENGSHVEGPFFDGPQRVGQELNFSYVVINTNEGHNLPTASLGAQPQLWANVVLVGPDCRRLWESGYLDANGDLADIHSVAVRNKELAFDWQLFNLQTMFLITGAKGTDREFYLPVNIDIDPLPFIRPAPQPVSVINHPPLIRMEARSLAPLGSRRVPYKVPAQLMCQPGRYRLSFRMRNRTEPLYFMRFCESTVEMQRAMLEGTLDFHESSVEFEVR